ncbi:hypothetical protein D917_00231 [Trichinella nativa]|uniref:Uncharacterized protein n=1 Tax=Trichinella nativa TaxID=6335 RepID=A0A1Y3EGF2_9BILA|nr:hypothetical protein D917_00231 [Trichinella nativa]
MLRSRLARLIDPFTSGISFILLRLLLIVYQFQNGIQSSKRVAISKIKILHFLLKHLETDDCSFTFFIVCVQSRKLSYASCLINRQVIIDLPRNRAILENVFAYYASFGKASLKACLLSYSLSEVSRGVSVVWPRRIPVIGRLFCPQIKWKN